MQHEMGPTWSSYGVCNPQGGNLRGWKVSTSVGWCPVSTTMWVKTSYKKPKIPSMYIFLLSWRRLFWEAVPSVAQMQESNLGGNLEANIFHIWCPIWVGCFFHLRRRWRLCITWRNGFGKTLVHMLLAPWKREISQNALMRPLQLWGWRTSSSKYA